MGELYRSREQSAKNDFEPQVCPSGFDVTACAHSLARYFSEFLIHQRTRRTRHLRYHTRLGEKASIVKVKALNESLEARFVAKLVQEWIDAEPCRRQQRSL